MEQETFRDVEVGEVFRFKDDLYAYPYRKRDDGWAELVDPTGAVERGMRWPLKSDPVIRDQKKGA